MPCQAGREDERMQNNRYHGGDPGASRDMATGDCRKRTWSWRVGVADEEGEEEAFREESEESGLWEASMRARRVATELTDAHLVGQTQQCQLNVFPRARLENRNAPTNSYKESNTECFGGTYENKAGMHISAMDAEHTAECRRIGAERAVRFCRFGAEREERVGKSDGKRVGLRRNMVQRGSTDGVTFMENEPTYEWKNMDAELAVKLQLDTSNGRNKNSMHRESKGPTKPVEREGGRNTLGAE